MQPKYHTKLVELNQLPRKPSKAFIENYQNDLIGDFGGGAMDNPAMQMLSQMMGVQSKPTYPGKSPEQSAEEAMKSCPISYAKVLQANPVIYDPETAQHAPAVLIAISDSASALDLEKLDDILAQIDEIRSEEEVPEDDEVAEMLELLDNPESSFKIQVPKSLTGNEAVWIWDLVLDPDLLAEGYVTDDTVIPGLSVDVAGRFDFYPMNKKFLKSLSK